MSSKLVTSCMDALRGIVFRLVARKMSGKVGLIEALHLRYNTELRWSEIRDAVKVYNSKFSVKASVGFVAVNPLVRDRILRENINVLMNLIDDVPQLVVDGRCVVCGTYLKHGSGETAHVLRKHRGLVNEYTEKIINHLTKYKSLS